MRLQIRQSIFKTDNRVRKQTKKFENRQNEEKQKKSPE